MKGMKATAGLFSVMISGCWDRDCGGRRALDRLLQLTHTPAVKLSRLALFVALALLVASLVADAQPPIRIGASVAQTGTHAALGQDQLRGYQLCVKHMNEKGGVLGRKLELVVYDDGSDPATAVRLYEKLITQERVEQVLGPYHSAITDPVANVTEKHKMPMVVPIAGATSIY